MPTVKSAIRHLALLFMVLCPTLVRAEDLVEFLNGAKARGKVLEIRKEQKEFDLEVQVGGRKLTRTYTFDKVLAVTMNGTRHVLTERPAAGSSPTTSGSGEVLRTKAEIVKFIDEVGRTPPEWFDATPLEHPDTLDLSWPLHPPEKDWNNQKNVGQYIWDIIHPNPDRWRGGVRLLHHLLTVHKEPALLQRDMKSLGAMYFELLQDYPRAAFWLRQAKVVPGEPQSVMLGECYWRLGNQQMALEMLSAQRLPVQAIKLYGDMGQTDKAIQLAKAFGKVQPHESYLLGGDACRLAGRLPQAIDFYQQVLDSPEARNEEYGQRYRGRATDSIEAIKLFDQADVRKVADGSYKSESVGYSGQIEIEVQVASGRISDLQVLRHQEKQFYAALTDTPAQIIKKQSVRGIDATSRATITSQAIVNATAKALAQGAQ